MGDDELYLAMDGFKSPDPNSRFNNRRFSEIPAAGPPYPPPGHTLPSPGPPFNHSVPLSMPDRHAQPLPGGIPGRPPPAPSRTNYSQVNIALRKMNRGPTNNSEPLPPPRPPYNSMFDDDLNPPHVPQRPPPNDPAPPPRPAKPPVFKDDQAQQQPSYKPLQNDDKRWRGAPQPRRVSNDVPPPIEPRRQTDGEDLYLQIDEISHGVKDVTMFQQQTRMSNEVHDPGPVHQNHFQQFPSSPGRHGTYVPNEHPGEKRYEPNSHTDQRSRNIPATSPTGIGLGFQPANNRTPLPSPRRHSGNSYGGPRRDGSNRSQGSSSSCENIDAANDSPRRHSREATPQRSYQPIKNNFDNNKFVVMNPPSVSGSLVMPPVTFPRNETQNSGSGTFVMPPLISTKNLHQSTSAEANTATETSGPIQRSNELNFRSKNVDEQHWYKNMDRKKAEQAIGKNLTDGCFIVRPGKGIDTPYSLTVCYDSHMSNLQIRMRDDGNFAFGKEKENERSFPNVVDLISYHMESALILADSKGSVVLTGPP